MNRYLTEFIGTFFLVLIIGYTGDPLAVGVGLSVLVYMGGHISGAHYNPAVTLAFVLRGGFRSGDAVPYVAAQILAGFLAALVVAVTAEQTFGPVPSVDASLSAVVIGELLFTFLLVLVILHVASAPTLEGNQFYGAAIGLTVMAGAYAVGPISGAAFNPAVGIGPNLVQAMWGEGSLASTWIYVVVPAVGGVVAVAAYRAQMKGVVEAA